MRFLTMEETFVVTYMYAIIVGIILGVITYFLFKKDSNSKQE